VDHFLDHRMQVIQLAVLLAVKSELLLWVDV